MYQRIYLTGISEDLSVSELSKDISNNENTFTDEKTLISSRSMLITIVLLISSLVLTSAMMLHYAAGTPESDDMEAEQEASPSLKAFSELFARKETTNAAAATDPDSRSPINRLFGGDTDSVRWPKLELTGFGRAADRTESFAIINRKQYYPGQLINDKVALIDILGHGVVVAYMGETNTITVNVNH